MWVSIIIFLDCGSSMVIIVFFLKEWCATTIFEQCEEGAK
jgi:hypothetical protein